MTPKMVTTLAMLAAATSYAQSIPCEGGDSSTGNCEPQGLCSSKACDMGESCNPANGLCECSATSCGWLLACNEKKQCAPRCGWLGSIVCNKGESCDWLHNWPGACECTATSCPEHNECNSQKRCTPLPLMVTITTPKPRQSINIGLAIPISVDTYSYPSALSRLDFYLSSNDQHTSVITVKPPRFGITWRISDPLAQLGTYTIKVVATNEYQMTAMDQVPIIINEGPGGTLVSITRPENGDALVVGSKIPLEAATINGPDPVVQVAFFFDGTWIATATSEHYNATYNATWDSAGARPGRHSIKAVVTDSQQHQSEAEISIVLVLETQAEWPGQGELGAPLR